MSEPLTPAHLASIRDRQNHGGVWSPREAQMKADIADLLAYVDALTAKPGKVARWVAGDEGGRLVSAAGSTLWTYYRRDDGRWNIDHRSVMYQSAITDSAARSFVEGSGLTERPEALHHGVDVGPVLVVFVFAHRESNEDAKVRFHRGEVAGVEVGDFGL